MKSLAERHAMLVAVENNLVSGGSYNHAIASGDLISPEVTSNPTAAGIQQYFVLRVFGSCTNSHASQVANITDFGAANLLQRIEVTDTAGTLRHSGVSGKALELLAYARQYDVVGGAVVEDANYGIKLGAGGSDVMPATIAAAGGTASFSHTFIIPFAVSAVDQRGAMATILQQGQQTLKLRFPTKAEAFVAVGANPLNAMYTGGTVAYTALGYELVTVTKDRNLPAFNDLPIEVFADIYQLWEGAETGLVAGSDKLYQLNHGRQHQNAFIIFDNGGTFNYETDVDSLSVIYAGSQDAKRASPYIHNMFAKNTLNRGLPPATYYFNWRQHPMVTSEKGGAIDIAFKPKTLNAGAKIHVIMDYVSRGTVSLA
jgi:hypothetical protein